MLMAAVKLAYTGKILLHPEIDVIYTYTHTQTPLWIKAVVQLFITRKPRDETAPWNDNYMIIIW